MAENYLQQNATINYIDTLLHYFPCEFVFSPPLSQQCDQFIDQYVPQLIQWIEANEPPTVFCKQVGLC